ncbi:MAG: hypothetical protein GX087_07440 [Desulfobulbaceae bacterium]|nr:hypothetical protein [Desulfobulbaceae bacterium]
MQTLDTKLRELTVADLRDWAGSTIYNRGKGYVGRVWQLSQTEDGRLARLSAQRPVAWA